MLEARLRKLDGIQSAKVRGFDRESKFYFNLEISENKSVLPQAIRKMLEDLKTETKGDEDYPYNSMVITAITGKVEKSGDAWTFTARGSNQKYDLAATEALKKMVESGKSLLTVAGKVSDEQGKLRLEISDVKDPAN
ncbi:MAG TPA: hypothetical protein VNM14_00515 [Planctomycetota bacterium]|nr:hypothetical protein [Planctomycetota bacterium]